MPVEGWHGGGQRLEMAREREANLPRGRPSKRAEKARTCLLQRGHKDVMAQCGGALTGTGTA